MTRTSPSKGGRDGTPHHGGPQRGTEAVRGQALRRGLWIAVGVVFVLAVGLAIAGAMRSHPRNPAEAAIGGPFTAVDQDGRAVDQRVLTGGWTALFFGYTSCPDVCPTTLQTLAVVQEKLGAGKLKVVLATVDRQRDGPKELKVYLDQPGFPKPSMGLTGTPAQVSALAHAYKTYFARRPRADGGYDMDHSAFIYLIDPKGRFVETLSEQVGPDRIAADVAAAMRAG